MKTILVALLLSAQPNITKELIVPIVKDEASFPATTAITRAGIIAGRDSGTLFYSPGDGGRWVPLGPKFQSFDVTTDAGVDATYYLLGGKKIASSGTPTIDPAFPFGPGTGANIPFHNGTAVFVIDVGPQDGGGFGVGQIIMPFSAEVCWWASCSAIGVGYLYDVKMEGCSTTGVTLDNYQVGTGTPKPWPSGQFLFCNAWPL